MPPGRPKGSANKKKAPRLLRGQTKLQFRSFKLQHLAPTQSIERIIVPASGSVPLDALLNNRSSNKYESTSPFPHPRFLGVKKLLPTPIKATKRVRTLESQFASCGDQLEERYANLQRQYTSLSIECNAYNQARDLACSKVKNLNGVGSSSQTAALNEYQASL